MNFHRDASGASSIRVRIFDTTLRDGEQTPGVHITADQKAAIAERLEAFGVDTIEAGFPASSPGDAEAVSRIAHRAQCEVAALARCVHADIEAVVRALEPAARPVAHLVLGVSDIHLARKVGMDRAQALRAIARSVACARGHVGEVEFSLEDATRAEPMFVRQVVSTAVEAGATRINIADTVGCALPHEFGDLIADAVRWAGPDVVVSAHCHNDLGLATANAVEAVIRGARQVEVTVNGIGERAGNTALEEVAVVLALKRIAHTGIDLSQIASMSEYVSRIAHVPVQPNRAIVGANAFAHSSGIHQDGILKDPENYEFVPPRLVGVKGHRFVLTARSGRRAIAHEAAALGHELAPDQVDQVYARFLSVADRAEGAVDTTSLGKIVCEVMADETGRCGAGFQPRLQRGWKSAPQGVISIGP